MDWTMKAPFHWDWETFAVFRGKESENSKDTKEPEWKVEGSIVNGNGSGHPSGSGACSGSELGNCSSKGSVSAPIDCLSKAGRRASEFNFDSAETFPENLNNEKDICKVDVGASSFILADGPKESLIGLKLGKRMYFEDVCAGSNYKNSSSSVSMTTSSTLVKKPKVPQQSMQSAFCQVEGCNMDLTTAKEYHRKHRVCERHSKTPKVIVAGQERRFCQQCSRFHGLYEFDQKKRSCRRRLSDHNARRRKPQPETISFSSSLFPMSCYDDRHQINLVFGQDPLSHVTSMATSTCDSSGGFKLTQSKGSWIKSSSTGGMIGELHIPSTSLPSNVSTVHHDLERLLPFKGTTAEVLNQGMEASVVASALDGAPDLRRALSLLSTSSWDSANSGPTSGVHFMNTNNIITAHPAMQMIDSTSGVWVEGQPLARTLSIDLQNSSSHFQQIQLLRTPYDTNFFDSSHMH